MSRRSAVTCGVLLRKSTDRSVGDDGAFATVGMSRRRSSPCPNCGSSLDGQARYRPAARRRAQSMPLRRPWRTGQLRLLARRTMACLPRPVRHRRALAVGTTAAATDDHRARPPRPDRAVGRPGLSGKATPNRHGSLQLEARLAHLDRVDNQIALLTVGDWHGGSGAQPERLAQCQDRRLVGSH